MPRRGPIDVRFGPVLAFAIFAAAPAGCAAHVTERQEAAMQDRGAASWGPERAREQAAVGTRDAAAQGRASEAAPVPWQARDGTDGPDGTDATEGTDGTEPASVDSSRAATGAVASAASDPCGAGSQGWDASLLPQKLLADPGGEGDQFGYAVAICGDTAVVGSTHGFAYILQRAQGSWSLAYRLAVTEDWSGDYFGSRVALAADRVLIGAPQAERAYVFVRDGGGWSLQQELSAEDGERGDWFGDQVALSGTLALVGARRDDDRGTDAGAVYAFELDDGHWDAVQKLVAADAQPGDEFGSAIALSGELALIGAWHADDEGEDFGAAYAFAHDPGAWSQQQKLTGGPNFGNGVTLSGQTAIISAQPPTVFARSDGLWEPREPLLADGLARTSAALSLYGDRAVVGYAGTDRLRGSAYLYSRHDQGFTQTQLLDASDGESGDRFGWSVAVSHDTVLVGSMRDDDLGTEAGAAYLFSP